MKTTGSRIKELRLAHDWFRVDLAGALQVSAVTILDYETDQIEIPESKLNAIAKIFDVSLDYLSPQS